MTLCRLMVWDFTDQTGRYDDIGQRRYSDSDLEFGAAYARWLMSDGLSIEPFLGFDLAAFAAWCDKKRGDGESACFSTGTLLM